MILIVSFSTQSVGARRPYNIPGSRVGSQPFSAGPLFLVVVRLNSFVPQHITFRPGGLAASFIEPEGNEALLAALND